MDYKISFLGAGKMATALASGLRKTMPADALIAYDISLQALADFASATGGLRTTLDISEAIDFADVIVIAVKPQNFSALFDSVGNRVSQKLIISIMAGIKISSIEKKSQSSRIIRVMPNTPAIVGKGVSAFSASEKATEQDIKIAEQILGAVGSSIRVKEDMMDAVTALSGSGPAYVFEFIESLARGGEKAGLPYETALKLAADTVEGAAVLLKKTGLAPEKLKQNVVSPGGTTAKALEYLSNANFRDIIKSAILAARDRSIELGKNQ